MNPPDTKLVIDAFHRPDCYPHPVHDIEIIETHISVVILTGEYAYKIKKPVDFGFLDFSTLDKRRLYCEEELRLNRRLAPDIYLSVVAITGSATTPRFEENGDGFEYAVKMRQFDPAAQLDHLLQREGLSNQLLDQLAITIADFHQQLDADTENPYGTAAQVHAPVQENFIHLRQHLHDQKSLAIIDRLAEWSENCFQQLQTVFTQRKADGFIRECHGDLHLRNIAWQDNKLIIFDGIEFNPGLRWIDVLSEVAFLYMDLEDRKQTTAAHRLLNTYLEKTGDYAGLSILPYYLVYRAMVRAKVDVLRLAQTSDDKEHQELLYEIQDYLALALHYTERQQPVLLITRGLSGSGKSTLTLGLLERIGAIRIRSDVERKRLFGINTEALAAAAFEQALYSPAATQQTYDKLEELASAVLAAGYSVIIDATNLQRWQRDCFYRLAQQHAYPFWILELIADSDTLRQRLLQRQHDVSDASLDVLSHQLNNWQALDNDELSYAVTIDTTITFDIEKIIEKIQS